MNHRSLALKLGAIALLILLLLVPLLMIGGLIQERQQLRDGVLEDIARSSSGSQQLTGPSAGGGLSQDRARLEDQRKNQ